MGLRFHKSIKIASGVKLNISKTGPSLSIGGHGLTLNLGKNGVTGNASLKGTGLSYRKKLMDNPLKSMKKSNKEVGDFHVDMDELGNVTILDGSQKEITDASTLRKIKATDEYKEEKERLETLRLEHLDELLEKKQEETQAFIHIYQLGCQVLDEEGFKKIAGTPYKKDFFKEAQPSETSVKMLLEKEAQENITGSIFTVNNERDKYVKENLPTRYQQLLEQWQEKKEEFEQNEEMKEREYQSYKNVLNKKEEDLYTNIDTFIGDVSLPVEIFVNYDFKDGCLMVDLDLPEIENLPTTEYVQGAKGSIKEKNKTQTEIKDEYITCVFGIATFLASHLFNQSLLIEKMVISAYTQRRNSSGDMDNEYIYSVKFDRSIFEKNDVSKLNPYDFCMSCENRCNITAQKVMKKIEPYQSY